ncbi:MAG: hypothetical protein HKN76_13635 [Saprospiraceae bacterium]|nr:hypothetical protein [Saprospiraceae bacterium]
MNKAVVRIINQCCVASLLGWLVLTSCRNEQNLPGEPPPPQLPELFADGHYNAMVETPVGSNYEFTYDPASNVIDTLRPEAGPTDYLPFPANFGFFPLLKNDSLVKIPVWILGIKQPGGTAVAVKLLGLIDYTDRGNLQRQWLAIPRNPELQTIATSSFRDFIIRYDPVKFMFEYWLKNRHGIGSVSQIIWHDEEQALHYLEESVNK